MAVGRVWTAERSVFVGAHRESALRAPAFCYPVQFSGLKSEQNRGGLRVLSGGEVGCGFCCVFGGVYCDLALRAPASGFLVQFFDLNSVHNRGCLGVLSG